MALVNIIIPRFFISFFIVVCLNILKHIDNFFTTDNINDNIRMIEASKDPAIWWLIASADFYMKNYFLTTLIKANSKGIK